MKRLIIIISTILACTIANAQSTTPPIQTQVNVSVAQDSTFVVEHEAIDSTLLGMDIFSAMPSKAKGNKGNVKINQSIAIHNAVKDRVSTNEDKEINGYRVRIYFSNSQNARMESARAVSRFREKYSSYSVYHSFTSPNFKVTVGNFRTKSEALELLGMVKKDFPSAFVVKEKITVGY